MSIKRFGCDEGTHLHYGLAKDVINYLSYLVNLARSFSDRRTCQTLQFIHIKHAQLWRHMVVTAS